MSISFTYAVRTQKHKCFKSFAAREEVLEKIVQQVYGQRNIAIKDKQQQLLLETIFSCIIDGLFHLPYTTVI